MKGELRFGKTVILLFAILGIIIVWSIVLGRAEVVAGEKETVGGVEVDDFSEFDVEDEFDENERTTLRDSGGTSGGPSNSPPVAPSKGSDKDRSNIVDDKPASPPDKLQEPKVQGVSKTPQNEKEDEDEVVVEDDGFEGDDDEFEDDLSEHVIGKKKEAGPPKLTITSAPMPMRGWQAYWAELLMLFGISIYLLNYMMGKTKNQKIAQTFFDIHWQLLEENFHFLGDSSIKVEDETGTRQYSKMSDSLFQIWCSGRLCCEGMLVELKLLKRQDIVSIISNLFRPAKDIFRFTVELAKEDMDSIIFALANRKTATKISKEFNDLIHYCPDKKPGEKFGLPNSFVVMSELNEVISSALDSKTISVINKCAPHIESIHFTDQFTGTKSAEPEVTKDGLVKAPEPKRLLIFTFALPLTMSGNNVEEAIEETRNLVPLVFHTIDRVKRIRLSKEGRAKADKNRAKVEEAFMKQTHAARAEALAAKKEEQRRMEKERILQEDDPEKQRRWEEKEQKREKKKKQPKMKQMKVKAM